MNQRWIPLAALIVAVTVPLSAQQDYPPGTFRLTPRTSIDLVPVPVHVPPQFSHLPDDLSVNLPPGFRASVFAAFPSVTRPRLMAFDANGVLHVANMDDDQIIALPDRDGDGVADEAIVAADNFSRPHSIAFHDGALYVGDRPQIIRFRDADGDLVYEERELLVDNIPSTGSHSTRTLVIDAANDRMFLAVGWPCDLCRLNDPERGSVLVFDLDGGNRRIYAEGVRNLLGMALDPRSGRLWATNNGYDLQGIDGPPEWVDIIREGGFYGMPFGFGYRVWADFSIPAYRDEILPLTAADSARVERMERPAALLPPHTAPMGIHFYDHERFPRYYRNAAFIALHAGHGKLAAIEGYSVVALFADADGRNARYEDFMTGFQTGTEIEDVWGFPVGLTTDTEGRLYVSSDLGNRLILRIDHSPVVARTELGLPDSVAAGAWLNVNGVVHLDRLDPEGGAPRVIADFSDLRGPREVTLTPDGEGRFRLRSTFTAGGAGVRHVRLTVQQPASPTDHVIDIARSITVLPQQVEDVVLFDDELAPGWNIRHLAWGENRSVDLNEDGIVFEGEKAARFRVFRGLWDWVVRFLPQDETFDPTGYQTLHFAFHAGPFDREPTEDFNLYAGETLIDLVAEGYVDITSKEWQVVDVPLSALDVSVPWREITFGGDFSRSFYLDDVRLVASSPPTAVTDAASTPAGFELGIGYPNPFNAETVIPFRLNTTAHAQLTIHNLAGQQVAELLNERLPAGAHTVRWSADTEDLATGVYFVRLTSGEALQTRKVMLLR